MKTYIFRDLCRSLLVAALVALSLSSFAQSSTTVITRNEFSTTIVRFNSAEDFTFTPSASVQTPTPAHVVPDEEVLDFWAKSAAKCGKQGNPALDALNSFGATTAKQSNNTRVLPVARGVDE